MPVQICSDDGKRRLRVLLLNDSARIGGAERGLMYLAKDLDPQEFDVTVVCPETGPFVELLENNRIAVIPMDLSHFSIKTRSTYVNYLKSLCKLYRLIKRLDIDILHCNSCRAAHWGVPLSRLLGVRTICHVRDNRYTKSTQFLLKHAPLNVELIAVSAATKKALCSTGVQESRIRVIYNGEDPEFYQPDWPTDTLAREFPGVETTFKIGIIGRIVEWKRHIDLIEAVGLLRDKLDLQVFIVGELWRANSDLMTLLQNRIHALRLNDRVICTGFRKDVREIMAGLDVVVVPSEEEPFGRATLEAMAMSKPVIGTLSGGTPELIRSGIDGLLVPVKDPPSLAKAIETLATNRQYAATLAANARRRLLMAFSVQNHIKQIRALYLERSYARP